MCSIDSIQSQPKAHIVDARTIEALSMQKALSASHSPEDGVFYDETF